MTEGMKTFLSVHVRVHNEPKPRRAGCSLEPGYEPGYARARSGRMMSSLSLGWRVCRTQMLVQEKVTDWSKRFQVRG